MRKKLRAGIALACNAVIVLTTFYSVLSYFWRPENGFMAVKGFTCFRYFTIDSNVLCAVGSAVALVCEARILSGKGEGLPVWAVKLYYLGTAGVTVTLLTVLFFLGPTLGYKGMFGGNSLWLHGVNPVLAMVVLCLIEAQKEITLRDLWLSVLPVAVYGCVYLCLVVFADVWPDFYGFNAGGMWYVSAPIMFVSAALIGLGLCGLRRWGGKER